MLKCPTPTFHGRSPVGTTSTGEITVDPKTDPNAESSSSSSSSSSSVEEEEVDFRWRSHDGFPDFNAGGMCGSCDDMFFGVVVGCCL